MKKLFSLVFLVSCFLFLDSFLYADPSSTNFSLSGQFTGGSSATSSSNYEVQDGSLTGLAQTALTSTSYQLGTGAEASAPAAIAVITAVSPAAYAKFFHDSTADFTVTAADPDSDALEYKAYQGGSVKDGPQSSNALSWALSASDIGRRVVELQVLDPDGTISRTKDMYVVRRPVK